METENGFVHRRTMCAIFQANQATLKNNDVMTVILIIDENENSIKPLTYQVLSRLKQL